MPQLAVKLGLQPPRASPGHWFPEEQAAGTQAWKISLSEYMEMQKKTTTQRISLSSVIEWTSQMVYIGRGCHVKGLAKSKWCNPFIIGQHGTREEVLATFKRWFLQQDDTMPQLVELRGKQLVCHCGPKQRCHSGFIIEVLSESFQQHLANAVYVCAERPRAPPPA